MELPDRVERKFLLDDGSSVPLVIRSGYVNIHGVGPLSSSEAERFGDELRRAAQDSEFFGKLHAALMDVDRCSRCDAAFREGVATVQDPENPTRSRHASGSPECRPWAAE